MKNQKKQEFRLKKLTIAKLQPDVIAKFKGGEVCLPTQIVCPSGNPCYLATGNPCVEPD